MGGIGVLMRGCPNVDGNGERGTATGVFEERVRNFTESR